MDTSLPKETRCKTKSKRRFKNKQSLLFEACNDFKILQELDCMYEETDNECESEITIGEIKPRNENQKIYLEYLKDKSNEIVIGKGPSGCGKTYCALLYALREIFEYKTYKKLLITRPIVTVANESLGYLKGGINDKMDPYLQPLYDIFDKYIKKEDLKYYVNEKIIEIGCIGFLRGRSLSDAIILVDESQNTTVEQMKTILTRIGSNCKIIFTGDLQQSDLLNKNNGLLDFINRFKNHDPSKTKFIKLIEFTNEDIVRNPIIKTILDMYNEN